MAKMNINKIALFSISVFSLSILCCFKAYASAELDAELAQMQNSVVITTSQSSAPPDNLRLQAIHEAAFIYGVQSGSYARWQEIEDELAKRNQRLSQVFNFSGFYLKNGQLQPPILDTAKAALSITPDGNSRTTTAVLYRVRAGANFVSTPLTWQRILLPDGIAPPPEPTADLMPKNSAEKALWQQQIASGWKEGISESNNEFDLRLDALNSAYQGMALYTKLAIQGMIEPPKVVSSTTAISADAVHLSIGTEEQHITQPAYWVKNTRSWQPVVYQKPFISGDLS